ncbi:MAG: hypothetical protein V4685_04155 [Bacteroidota bacterium]
MKKGQLKLCSKGHHFYKSSDCPVCPVCEKEKKPLNGFLSKLSAPARRALENKGITSLKELSAYSEKEILQLHGIGKTAIPLLATSLKEEGFSFKK